MTWICGNSAGVQTVSVTTATGAISWVGAAVTRTQDFTVTGVPATIALTASPAAIACNGASHSTVTALVTDSAGNNVPDGTVVTFSVVSQGTANPINTTTTAGVATSTVTPLSGDISGVVVNVSSGAAQRSRSGSTARRRRVTPAPTPCPSTSCRSVGLLNTVGFSTESGEPLPCGDIGATAWYKLTLPVSNVAITVDTVGSNFNTALAVYTAADVRRRRPVADRLRCECVELHGVVRRVFAYDVLHPGRRRERRDGKPRTERPLYERCGLRRPGRRRRGRVGTNPNSSDTDGDGLSDGLEVFTYHTNPLVADTDADGCGDGLEVTALAPTPRTHGTSTASRCRRCSPRRIRRPSFPTQIVAAADAQAVFAYFKGGAQTGTALYEQDLNQNGINDGVEYDRSVVGPAQSGPPDGVVAAADAQLAFAQFKRVYVC